VIKGIKADKKMKKPRQGNSGENKRTNCLNKEHPNQQAIINPCLALISLYPSDHRYAVCL
jgi:hypothetical protein